jgi:hypothetical protein
VDVENVMSEDADDRFVREWRLTLPLDPEETLLALETMLTADRAAGFRRLGGQVLGESSLGWTETIDGKSVAGAAPVGVTVTVTDDSRADAWRPSC